MKTGEIRFICDCCEKDLTYTGYSTGLIIRVSNQVQSHHPDSNVVYSCDSGQQIEDKHFCNMKCASKWFVKENEKWVRS